MSGTKIDSVLVGCKLNRLESAAFQTLLKRRGIRASNFLKTAIATAIESEFEIENPAKRETPVA